MSLWRDRNFLRFWGGQALSQAGEEVSAFGIPVIAVLLLQATAFEVGVLNAATTAAFLLVGLPAGVWIDRMRKRRVMIAADAVRVVAIAAIPVLFVAGALDVVHLVAIGFVVGVATVFFDVAYQSVIPALVPPGRIPEANGRVESTAQIAHLGGPAAAGWLVGVLTAPIAMVVTAATYAASVVALLGTRDHEQPRAADDRAPLHREVAEGLRWVFGHPLLRRIVGTTAGANLFGTITGTLLPILLLRSLGQPPAVLGLVYSLGAVGGVLGAALSGRIVRRLGEGPAIPVSAVAFGVAALLVPIAAVLPVAAALPLLVVQGVLFSLAVVVYNVTAVSFRQRITPSRLLGRMNASNRFVMWGVMPIGALAAGVLASTVGLVPALWIGAAGQVLAIAFVLTGPFLRMRELPSPGEAEGPEGPADGDAT